MDFPNNIGWKKDDKIALQSESLSDLEHMHVRGKTFAEPQRSLVLSINEDTPIWKGRIAYWKPSPWDNHDGRVTLAGDAAHPMTFHRGQGLNHGIADAAKLVQAFKKADLGEETLAKAISEYEEEMIARGAAEVELSLKNTILMHQWDLLMSSPLMKMGAQRT